MLRDLAGQKIDEIRRRTVELGRLGEGIDDKVFAEYRAGKSENTLRRQDADLALFAEYIFSKGVRSIGKFEESAVAWEGVTWGLAAGFQRWQLAQGYAISSINGRMSTVKIYARLAVEAGALDAGEYALIRAVECYSREEGERLDSQRGFHGGGTRLGAKKAEAVRLNEAQAAALKAQPDTPQGHRDMLLMCLLLDHGLRVGEVVELQAEDFDLREDCFRFYRRHVKATQEHVMTQDTLRAAWLYLVTDGPKEGVLLRGSVRSGELRGRMSARAVTKRVRMLGEAAGIEGLSPQDCRHYWAMKAAREGMPIGEFWEAGGWRSLTMPMRYVEAAREEGRQG